MIFQRHSLLNPSLFPLFPCNCLATFLNCLSNLAKEESKEDAKKVSIEESNRDYKEDAIEKSREDARRLERVWRTYGGHCYNLERKTRCIQQTS